MRGCPSVLLLYLGLATCLDTSPSGKQGRGECWGEEPESRHQHPPSSGPGETLPPVASSPGPHSSPSKFRLLHVPKDLPVAQTGRNLRAIQETRVWSLGQEDLPKKGMAIHSSILAWRIPWTEAPGGLQSVGSQRVGHN